MGPKSRDPLDSLLGMEKSKIEAMEYGGVYTIGPFQDEYNFMEQNNQTVVTTYPASKETG